MYKNREGLLQDNDKVGLEVKVEKTVYGRVLSP
jgi:hypothetical protein